VAQPIFIEPSRIAITITDINQPISNDVNLVFRVGDNAPGTIKLSGQADIAEAGKLALEKLTARQSLSIASLDLAAASAFAPADITLAGVANGALEINATGTTDGQV